MELIRYHLPTFVKHVLAPKNEFGMPKMTWRNYKSFGIRATPSPPCWEKFPKNVVFFTSPLIGHVLLKEPFFQPAFILKIPHPFLSFFFQQCLTPIPVCFQHSLQDRLKLLFVQPSVHFGQQLLIKYYCFEILLKQPKDGHKVTSHHKFALALGRKRRHLIIPPKAESIQCLLGRHWK